MKLSPYGREYYGLGITTTPTTLTTDWQASFDGGTTWVTAVDVNGHSAWLVAGPKADPTGAVVLAGSMYPLVRLTANPEIVVRDAPHIQID